MKTNQPKVYNNWDKRIQWLDIYLQYKATANKIVKTLYIQRIMTLAMYRAITTIWTKKPTGTLHSMRCWKPQSISMQNILSVKSLVQSFQKHSSKSNILKYMDDPLLHKFVCCYSTFFSPNFSKRWSKEEETITEQFQFLTGIYSTMTKCYPPLNQYTQELFKSF